MVGYRYVISLRIWHRSRPLDDLTIELGLVPDRVWRAGAQRMTLNGTPRAGVYDDNFWTVELLAGEASDRDLAGALTGVLDRLSGKKEFIQNLVGCGANCELFVGWFFDEGNSGDVLDYALMERLAEFRINLSFDVYASAIEE